MRKDLLDSKCIILFDGICSLCNKYIVFIARNDVNDYFRFSSIQANNIKDSYKLHDIDLLDITSICLITKDGILKKSDAVIFILSRLRFPYNLASIFYVFPKIFRDMIYDLVANNRYRIFGKINYCSILHQNRSVLKNKIIK